VCVVLGEGGPHKGEENLLVLVSWAKNVACDLLKAHP
jgi:hypothetical protein